MHVGTKVWFTPGTDVNEQDHGLEPGVQVQGMVTETNVLGPEWFTVSYDEVYSQSGAFIFQREISAHISELEVRD